MHNGVVRPLVRAAMAITSVVGISLATILPSSALTPRIVGGTPISISQSPWQVIMNSNGNLCSGSLINVDWVLTAAHCVSGISPSSISVWAGLDLLSQRSSTPPIGVSTVIIHPNWDRTAFNSDLALVQLSAPVTLDANIQLINLPSAVDPQTWPAVGTTATITGWGAQSFNGSVSDALRSANVSILTSPGAGPCGDYGSDYQPIDDLCAGSPAGGVDACQGDSGGPLVVTEGGVPFLAGVTSLGNECGLPNYPGIYTRVTTHIGWIRGVVPVPITTPGTPAGLTIVPASTGVVTAVWQPVTNLGNDSAVTYRVSRIQADGSIVSLCETVDVQCQIKGLKVGTRVTFVVQSFNSAQVSDVSAPVIAVPVNTVSNKGAVVTKAKVASFAGLTKAQAKQAKLTVRTPAKCKVTSKGVALKASGLCIVAVQSLVRESARGRAYIQVR